MRIFQILKNTKPEFHLKELKNRHENHIFQAKLRVKKTFFLGFCLALLRNVERAGNLVCGAPTDYLESTAFGAMMSVPHRTFFVVERIKEPGP